MKSTERANSPGFVSVFAALIISFLAACGSSTKTVTAPITGTEAIGTTSGTPQSTAVSTPFAAPLIATVTLGGSPVSGAVVTFAAPATGASGTFAGGASTATTNASGIATSAVFSANGTAGAYAVTASVAGASTPASFKMTNTSGASPSIATTSGTPQSVAANTSFAAPLVATVTADGVPVGGVVVTFTAPASGASGTFPAGQPEVTKSNARSAGVNTNTATTNASGIATSTAFTANSTAGAYTVTASIADGATASFNMTNTAATSSNFSFYLSGLNHDKLETFYALAGSVIIDSTGAVLGGEQDYNDAVSLQSPQPSGDIIVGGGLEVNPYVPGQGTLSLVTNNPALGVNGTETLGLQFVNNNHALIIQYDGSATSSGSLDLQTLPSTPTAPSGGYAFTLSGEDTSATQTVYGGVFSISGGAMTGTYDVNDLGDMFGAVTGLTLSDETVSTPDSFGRGTMTNSVVIISNPLTTLSLVYYIVGPEAIRLIDVDPLDTGVGSAFGQGASAGSFSNTSLGSSVFAIESNDVITGHPYAVAGQFTVPSSGTITGIEDDNEVEYGASDTGSISGSTYSIANNGYGSVTLTFEDILSLGIYMTDPNLNLSDPNSQVGGGGALLAEMDGGVFAGTGVVIPQTDTAAADFTGAYAFGAQALYTGGGGGEFDFVGLASVPSGTLINNGVGIASDPGEYIDEESPTTISFVPFSGNLTADGSNPGRYTMLGGSNRLNFGLNEEVFNVVIYQANGDQLFWVDLDGPSGLAYLGPVQQQGSLSSLSEIPPIQEPD